MKPNPGSPAPTFRRLPRQEPTRTPAAAATPATRRPSTTGTPAGRSARRSRPPPPPARGAPTPRTASGAARSAPSEPTTVNEAADELVAGMEAGTIRTRSGDRYKPSAIRGYREALDAPRPRRPRRDAPRRRSAPPRPARSPTGWSPTGCSPSTVRNALMPLRVIYRRAIRDGLVAVNPCDKARAAGEPQPPASRSSPPSTPPR